MFSCKNVPRYYSSDGEALISRTLHNNIDTESDDLTCGSYWEAEPHYERQDGSASLGSISNNGYSWTKGVSNYREKQMSRQTEDKTWQKWRDERFKNYSKCLNGNSSNYQYEKYLQAGHAKHDGDSHQLNGNNYSSFTTFGVGKQVPQEFSRKQVPDSSTSNNSAPNVSLRRTVASKTNLQITFQNDAYEENKVSTLTDSSHETDEESTGIAKTVSDKATNVDVSHSLSRSFSRGPTKLRKLLPATQVALARLSLQNAPEKSVVSTMSTTPTSMASVLHNCSSNKNVNTNCKAPNKLPPVSQTMNSTPSGRLRKSSAPLTEAPPVDSRVVTLVEEECRGTPTNHTGKEGDVQIVSQNLLQLSLPGDDDKRGGQVTVDSSAREGCICSRPVMLLHCRYCGHIMQGRVSRKCSSHTTQIFLMDLIACPECKSPASECMSEVDKRTGVITAPSDDKSNAVPRQYSVRLQQQQNISNHDSKSQAEQSKFEPQDGGSLRKCRLTTCNHSATQGRTGEPQGAHIDTVEENARRLEARRRAVKLYRSRKLLLQQEREKQLQVEHNV